MQTRLSAELKRAYSLAEQSVQRRGHLYVTPGHLITGLLDAEIEAGKGALLSFMELNGISEELLRNYAEATLIEGNEKRRPEGTTVRYSKGAANIRVTTALEAHKMNRLEQGTDHLLIAFLNQTGDPFCDILRSLEVDTGASRRLLASTGQRYGQPKGHALECLDADATKAFDLAYRISREYFSPKINTGHLLMALLKEPTQFGRSYAAIQGFDPELLLQTCAADIQSEGEFATTGRRFSGAVKRVFFRARRLASEDRRRWVGIDHLFEGLMPQKDRGWTGIFLKIKLAGDDADPGGLILAKASRSDGRDWLEARHDGRQNV